jgi:hypothetical protein
MIVLVQHSRLLLYTVITWDQDAYEYETAEAKPKSLLSCHVLLFFLRVLKVAQLASLVVRLPAILSPYSTVSCTVLVW